MISTDTTTDHQEHVMTGDGRGRPLNKLEGDDYWTKFARRLRQYRKRKYATQSEYAAALTEHGLKTAPNTVSQWESGKALPPIKALKPISEVLDCEIWQLFPEFDE